MKTKICTICKLEKSLNEFSNDSSKSFNKRGYCKACDNIKQKNYRKNNKFKTIQMWINTKCNNSNRNDYKYYGGKRIKNLLSLEELKILWDRDNADNMNKPSIDRIDSNDNYEYDNCRFIEMNDNIQERNNRFSKHITQYDLYGNFIKDWDSISIASKTLKINISGISNAINLKRKTAGGFKWSFKG